MLTYITNDANSCFFVTRRLGERLELLLDEVIGAVGDDGCWWRRRSEMSDNEGGRKSSGMELNINTLTRDIY